MSLGAPDIYASTARQGKLFHSRIILTKNTCGPKAKSPKTDEA